MTWPKGNFDRHQGGWKDEEEREKEKGTIWYKVMLIWCRDEDMKMEDETRKDNDDNQEKNILHCCKQIYEDVIMLKLCLLN